LADIVHMNVGLLRRPQLVRLFVPVLEHRKITPIVRRMEVARVRWLDFFVSLLSRGVLPRGMVEIEPTVQSSVVRGC